uniref:Interleukin-6 receptor subunit beta-like n=1 Tax=Cynoglossus semilaevis TaxID=244447 RepID=A0A3P8VJ71_CYNSE
MAAAENRDVTVVMASPPLRTLLVVMIVKIAAAAGSPLEDVDLSCYTENKYTSMTCVLSLDTNPLSPPDVTVVLKSSARFYDCTVIKLKNLNVTAHIKNRMNGKEIISLSHTRISSDTVKPLQPQVTVRNTTENSFAVSWTSSPNMECRLRFRANSSLHWSQAPGYVSTYQKQIPVYSIKNLLPYTTYKAAVACRGSVWSEWSSDVTVRTRDKVPYRSPEVFYQTEKTHSGSLLLHLMWKILTGPPGSPRILGYQVVYELLTALHPGGKLILNVTDLTQVLEVKEGRCTVTVGAFNTAGYGPTTRLDIDTRGRKNLSPVRNLWVSSFFPVKKSLLVQWKSSWDLTSDPQLSHLVMWHYENQPSTKRLAMVDASANASFVIEGVDLDATYVISVATVDQQQCGPPQSLSATLQLGALLEVGDLMVVAVNKRSVTVQWAWQKKSTSDKVGSYRLELMDIPPRQQKPHVLLLWPDDAHRHTFTSLSPNTLYYLHLLAGDDSKDIKTITTEFDYIQLVVTLLLLAVCLFIVCILSRTVYKIYFISYISSPQNSRTGQWLMEKNHQQEISKGHIMDMKDFEVTKKSVVVDRSSTLLLRLSSLDLLEDTALLPPPCCHTVITSDSEYVTESWPTAEKPPSYRPDLEVNADQSCSLTSEKTEANMSLQVQVDKAYIAFPQKEPNNIQLDLQGSQQTSLQHPGGGSLIYESVFNSSFLGESVHEDAPGQTVSPPMVLETDYIANSCLGVEASMKMDPEDTTH